MGLYEPTSGEISYDGININNHRKEWRNMLGYVPQEIFLLDNIIEDIAAEFDIKKIDKIKLKIQLIPLIVAGYKQVTRS